MGGVRSVPAMEETVVLILSPPFSSLMSSALSIVFCASLRAFLARLAKFEDGNQLMMGDRWRDGCMVSQ